MYPWSGCQLSINFHNARTLDPYQNSLIRELLTDPLPHVGSWSVQIWHCCRLVRTAIEDRVGTRVLSSHPELDLGSITLVSAVHKLLPRYILMWSCRYLLIITAHGSPQANRLPTGYEPISILKVGKAESKGRDVSWSNGPGLSSASPPSFLRGSLACHNPPVKYKTQVDSYLPTCLLR